MGARIVAMRRAAGLVSLVAGVALLTGACSLLVEKEQKQCVVDKDCQRFDAGSLPICSLGVCVASGLGPPGCFRGTPAREEELLNQCTTGKCVPFDNCARLRLCSGAALPATKDPPPGGVAP